MKGTRILTSNGYKKIEQLNLNDKLLTNGSINNNLKGEFYVKYFSTDESPIYGIGNFSIKKTSKKTAPICIKKNAFSINYPMNDLYVSPEHLILLPSKSFVKAKNLINGKTVVQDFTLSDVVYYHIELEKHSVITAENILSESYLDIGNRYKFENWIGVKREKLNSQSLIPNFNRNRNLNHFKKFNIQHSNVKR
jgi:hypothetical protein